MPVLNIPSIDHYYLLSSLSTPYYTVSYCCQSSVVVSLFVFNILNKDFIIVSTKDLACVHFSPSSFHTSTKDTYISSEDSLPFYK